MPNFIIMQDALLTVKKLRINFKSEAGNFVAVEDFSFSLMPGEIMAIVGESGSGKSVTALSLMQLLPKQTTVTGEILFTAKNQPTVNLQKISEKEMRCYRGNELAMIFQEPMTSLNPVFTCGNQVLEAIIQHQKISKKDATKKVIQLFEKVQLPNPAEMINRYPHQLSGGQKQRVMIAMAMSCNPSILIADEPTTALDVTVQKTILELIKDLQKENGMAVIFITHDLGLVADIADTILLMYKGKIVEQGNAATVLNNPKQNYTKALMACRPALYPKDKRLPVVADFFEMEDKLSVINNKLVVELQNNAAINYNEPVLKVENLKVYFPGKKSFFAKPVTAFKAVDGVSFMVSKGETLGLVGESGCGKTTLGRAILQLIPVTEGSIVLNGKNIVGLSKKILQPLRKDLQIVFQDPYGSLNPRLSIGSAILEPMKVHGILNSDKERKEKVMQLLEQVQLNADHYNRYPHQFSGGQRQRICIARALALKPTFLIFDESVSALDVSVQAQVLNLINDLKKEFDFTSIFISHDLAVVKYISDRILVMQHGKIVEEGTAELIYTNPQNKYTRQLIDAIPGKALQKN